jgi:NAD(P)-dependent dehydrogenase (short-subunit alcohol dehydrogenase family)
VSLDERSILLPDRVAVVTGAARGIGAATAGLLARCGAVVAACDRDPEVGQIGAALSRTLDVRDTEAVDQFLGDVRDRFGRVDVLVNNAGGTFVAPFVDASPKGEAMLIAENFGQVAHAIRTAVPLMPRGGAIVNVTSIEAHQAAPGFAVYSAMKAAVANLTRTLALELAPSGIRVNAVAPDALPTSGESGARDALLASGLPYRPAHLPPLGHFGTPEDGAAAVLFLASDLARFVTGTTVHVDGGTWAAGGWHRLPEEH